MKEFEFEGVGIVNDGGISLGDDGRRRCCLNLEIHGRRTFIRYASHRAIAALR